MTDRPPAQATPNPARSSGRLIAAMALAIVAVGVLAFLDEARESAATLEDFASNQSVLAQAVAADFAARLDTIRRDATRLGAGMPVSDLSTSYQAAALVPGSEPSPGVVDDGQSLLLSLPASADQRAEFRAVPSELFSGLGRIERPNALAVWFLPPGGRALVATDGRRLAFGPLLAAFEQGLGSLRLSREDAARFGLAPRTAFSGLASVSSGGLGQWGIAVIASAERERDRAARGRLRLLLSLTLAGGLVLTFGGFALRKQRQELTLDHALAVAAVERDRDERLARLSRQATTVTFASGMAHELSTPLGVIVGRAEQMLSRINGDERERRNLTSILEQAERMNQVIRGFLNLARGRPPVMQSVDPLAIVRSATALVEHRFDKKGVLLETSVPGGLMPIRGDSQLLEHALVNLLLNACDACQRGGHVLVCVSADEASLSFTVTDDGSGISPEDAARVTEPFFTTKPDGEGTGLGLAITNEIVKSHRGVLMLSPAHPRGTCATLQVPFVQGAVHVSA